MKKYLSIFLIFFLLFGVTVPAFADTTTEVLPPESDSSLYDSYLIYYDDYKSGWYKCVLYFASDFNLAMQPNSNVAFLYPAVSSPRPVYRKDIVKSDYNLSDSNNGWGSFSSFYTLTPDTITNFDGTKSSRISISSNMIGSDYIIYSTQDVKFGDWNYDTKTVYYTGDVFFSPTPPLVVATEEALALFQSQTTQTIMIIVLCGIGCLAFLISLPILRRVLLRFLNR